MKHFLRILPLLLAGIVWAEEPKSVDDVMKHAASKMAGYKTWTADYTQSMSMMDAAMTMTGQMKQRPPRNMWMHTEMSMMGQPSAITMILGSDGIMWQDMDMAGKRQVIKMDMGRAMSNMAASTGMNIDPLQQFDPRRQWEASRQFMDFTLLPNETLHDQPMYVLEGAWKEAALTNALLATAAKMTARQRLYIGQTDGFVHKMESFAPTGTNAVMNMEFKNIKFNEDMPDSTFIFTPPEGVPVMDMSAMMNAAMSGKTSPPPQDEPSPKK